MGCCQGRYSLYLSRSFLPWACPGVVARWATNCFSFLGWLGIGVACKVNLTRALPALDRHTFQDCHRHIQSKADSTPIEIRCRVVNCKHGHLTIKGLN